MAVIMSITQTIQFCENGRYIVLELLTALLSCLFWGFFLIVLGLLTWSFSSSKKYLETVLPFFKYIL